MPRNLALDLTRFLTSFEMTMALAPQLDRIKWSNHYVVEPIGGMPRAADDAVELRWFAFDEIPEDKIAFEHERDVLRDLRAL